MRFFFFNKPMATPEISQEILGIIKVYIGKGGHIYYKILI